MTIEAVKVYQDLKGENDRWSVEIRRLLAGPRLLMLNLIGSPGSGKTALLEATAPAMGDGTRMAVLEGDVATTRDAERIRALGVPASQLLSGGACHLEARLVHAALADLPLAELDAVFVENVGNMVCPAEFDIGEHAKVAVLSVAEGEDKPLKYPLLFQEAQAVVVTKTDLAAVLGTDMAALRGHLEAVHGGIPVFELSARTGEGLEPWLDWVRARVKALRG